MILKSQNNFVSYYKVVKETKCYMWIRELACEYLRTEGWYEYYTPIDDKFKSGEVLKLKKHYSSIDGHLTLWYWGILAITEYNNNPGYMWLGA